MYVILLQDVSQATIPYWRKDNLRNQIKSLKKSVDDIERNLMASIATEVTEEAKKQIQRNPDTPFIVHQFNALTNGKVLMEQLKNKKSCLILLELPKLTKIKGVCLEGGEGMERY